MRNDSNLLLTLQRGYILMLLPYCSVGDQQERAEHFSLCSCFSELLDVSVFIETCIGLQTAGWTLQYRLDLFTEHISEETRFTLMNWLLHVIYSESPGTVCEDFSRSFGATLSVRNVQITCVCSCYFLQGKV